VSQQAFDAASTRVHALDYLINEQHNGPSAKRHELVLPPE